MARVSQAANGDVVIRMQGLEIECLATLSTEGADIFADELASNAVFETDDKLKRAKAVYRAVLRARRLVAA